MKRGEDRGKEGGKEGVDGEGRGAAQCLLGDRLP